MRLPGFKRINRQDFPPASQNIIERLGGLLNKPIEAINDIINGKLTLKDNVNCDIVTVTASVDSTGKPLGEVQINLSTTVSIVGLQVVKVECLTNSTTYPTSTPYISYTQRSGVLIVNNIAGLPIGNKFKLTVVCFR